MCGNVYAWESSNPGLQEWDWDWKENPIIPTPSSCLSYLQNGWTYSITVLACRDSETDAGGIVVGTGEFIDNNTKIKTTINEYYSDMYYVVRIPWKNGGSTVLVTNYIYCQETHEDGEWSEWEIVYVKV